MLLHRKEPLVLIADIQGGKEVVSTFSLQITSHVDLKQLLRNENKQVDLSVAMVQVKQSRAEMDHSGPPGLTLVYLSHQHVQMILNVLVPRLDIPLQLTFEFCTNFQLTEMKMGPKPDRIGSTWKRQSAFIHEKPWLCYVTSIQ